MDNVNTTLWSCVKFGRQKPAESPRDRDTKDRQEVRQVWVASDSRAPRGTRSLLRSRAGVNKVVGRKETKLVSDLRQISNVSTADNSWLPIHTLIWEGIACTSDLNKIWKHMLVYLLRVQTSISVEKKLNQTCMSIRKTCNLILCFYWGQHHPDQN